MISDGMISLRAPEPSDVDIMYIWENDASVWEQGTVRAPMSRHSLDIYVRNYNPDPAVDGQLRLIIISVTDGTPIGCLDLYDFDHLNRRAGVGILIDEAFRSKGYCTAALLLFKQYCKKMLGLHQLWAIIHRDNEPSIRAFKSAGFKICGSLRSWIRTADKYHDAFLTQAIL